MHELKIIQDIFPIIESVVQENQLQSVSKVKLQVGALRQVVFDFLQFAFTTVAKDTVVADAELIIELIPTMVLCKTCQGKSIVDDNIYLCPKCGGTDLEVITGKEIVLASIEGEN